MQNSSEHCNIELQMIMCLSETSPCQTSPTGLSWGNIYAGLFRRYFRVYYFHNVNISPVTIIVYIAMLKRKENV